MTQEQIVATDHLNSCVCESPPPQPLMQPDAALAMLLHSNSVYKSDDLCAVRSDLAPYDCAKLSCPQNADFLMDVAESLSAPDSRLISGSGEHLLLTDTQYADKVDLDGGKSDLICVRHFTSGPTMSLSLLRSCRVECWFREGRVGRC